MELQPFKYASKQEVMFLLHKEFKRRQVPVRKRYFFQVLFSEMDDQGFCQITTRNLCDYCQTSTGVVHKYKDFFVSIGLISHHRTRSYDRHCYLQNFQLQHERLQAFSVSNLKEIEHRDQQAKDPICLPCSLFQA